MRTKYPEGINELLLEERGALCEYCKLRRWTEKHHCIIPRDIRYPELNEAINLFCTCHQCHETGEIDTFEAKRLFYFLQRARGHNPQQWIDELPLKIKPDFTRFQCNEKALAIVIDRPFRELLLMNLIN